MDDDTSTLAASLAFYTSFSLAPLLILFLAVSARLGTDLQQQLISEFESLAGPDAAKTVSTVIHGAAAEPHLTSLAGIAGLITLFISSGIIFGQLRATLNRVFGVKPEEPANQSMTYVIIAYLKGKLLHSLIAVAFILITIASIFASTLFPLKGLVLGAVISAMLYIAVFSSLFHFLPDRRMPWLSALEGGTITAVLFVIGKVLIGFYLGNAALGSAYGAAGSLIAFLAWVYYSALITFVGAQVSSLLGNKPVSAAS